MVVPVNLGGGVSPSRVPAALGQGLGVGASLAQTIMQGRMAGSGAIGQGLAGLGGGIGGGIAQAGANERRAAEMAAAQQEREQVRQQKLEELVAEWSVKYDVPRDQARAFLSGETDAELDDFPERAQEGAIKIFNQRLKADKTYKLELQQEYDKQKLKFIGDEARVQRGMLDAKLTQLTNRFIRDFGMDGKTAKRMAYRSVTRVDPRTDTEKLHNRTMAVLDAAEKISAQLPPDQQQGFMEEVQQGLASLLTGVKPGAKGQDAAGERTRMFRWLFDRVPEDKRLLVAGGLNQAGILSNEEAMALVAAKGVVARGEKVEQRQVADSERRERGEQRQQKSLMLRVLNSKLALLKERRQISDTGISQLLRAYNGLSDLEIGAEATGADSDALEKVRRGYLAAIDALGPISDQDKAELVELGEMAVSLRGLAGKAGPTPAETAQPAPEPAAAPTGAEVPAPKVPGEVKVAPPTEPPAASEEMARLRELTDAALSELPTATKYPGRADEGDIRALQSRFETNPAEAVDGLGHQLFESIGDELERERDTISPEEYAKRDKGKLSESNRRAVRAADVLFRETDAPLPALVEGAREVLRMSALTEPAQVEQKLAELVAATRGYIRQVAISGVDNPNAADEDVDAVQDASRSHLASLEMLSAMAVAAYRAAGGQVPVRILYSAPVPAQAGGKDMEVGVLGLARQLQEKAG